MMNITINGKTRELTGRVSLQDIIASSLPESRHVIAEVNGQIVTSARWGQTHLADGDKIELVTIVGGG